MVAFLTRGDNTGGGDKETFTHSVRYSIMKLSQYFAPSAAKFARIAHRIFTGEDRPPSEVEVIYGETIIPRTPIRDAIDSFEQEVAHRLFGWPRDKDLY